MRINLDALGHAAAFELAEETVAACLLNRAVDQLFARAWRGSLKDLEAPERRGALGGVTGHIAESVAEVLLADLGYVPVWHFKGPGGHGVDLLMLCPALERLLAIEVKGTLRPHHWPRFRRGELAQMSLHWMNKRDNPGMAEWGLEGRDVYGAAVLINFAQMSFKIGLTSDFVQIEPVESLEVLADLSWLDRG